MTASATIIHLIVDCEEISLFLFLRLINMYFLIPILNILGLELVFLVFPPLIYGVGIIMVLLTLFCIFDYTKENQEHRFALCVSSVLFYVAHFLLLLFLEGKWMTHSFIMLISFTLFIFLYSIYDRHTENQLKLNYALENIIGYLNLIIFFFATIDILYLDLNISQKFIFFVFLLSLITVFLTYSSLSMFHALSIKTWLYLSVITLIVMEMFWTAAFLPVSVYAKSVLLTLVYYVVLGISRHYLIFGIEEVSKKVVLRYITISLSGSLIVLLTTRWS